MAREGAPVPDSKVAGLRTLRVRGVRVLAVVDNEPGTLRAMATSEIGGEILFLHADTISSSQRRHDDAIVRGRDYRLRELVPERRLPDRVEFVWHGVNDTVNLGRFLAARFGGPRSTFGAIRSGASCCATTGSTRPHGVETSPPCRPRPRWSGWPHRDAR